MDHRSRGNTDKDSLSGLRGPAGVPPTRRGTLHSRTGQSRGPGDRGGKRQGLCQDGGWVPGGRQVPRGKGSGGGIRGKEVEVTGTGDITVGPVTPGQDGTGLLTYRDSGRTPLGWSIVSGSSEICPRSDPEIQTFPVVS